MTSQFNLIDGRRQIREIPGLFAFVRIAARRLA